MCEIFEPKLTADGQRRVLEAMSIDAALLRKEMEKLKKIFSREEFLKLLVWAREELKEHMESIRNWFSEFFKNKQLIIA